MAGSLLRGFAPAALRACPPAFVATRFRRYRSETVDGWATPIVSVHRCLAAAPLRAQRGPQ
jgi:hypothetical protein